LRGIHYLLLGFGIASFATMIWQWLAGIRFQIEKIPRQGREGGFPSLSILKPLKGCDSQTEGCLASWLKQNYPGEVELLFGIASSDDPVRGVVEKLLASSNAVRGELIICDPLLGSNAKVSSLCHMMKRAKHEIIIVADDDVVIQDGFLQELAAGFRNPEVGLVNCFYFIEPKNWAMRFEAIAVNADFWTQVLQGLMLKPMDFALGAVMATRREMLGKLGGFESLLEYLADDYQLGNKVAKTGAKLQICPTPVECRSDPLSAKQVWNHQLRWARTIRVCQPVPYFFSIISNPSLWPLLACILGAPGGKWLLLSAIIARIGTGAFSYKKLSGLPALVPGLLSPIKDLFGAAIWLLSFTGNKITWRGTLFRVNRGGKLTRIA